MDAPAGVTKEEGHTGFLHLPSAVLTSIFIVRRIQPPLSLVDRGVEFCVPTTVRLFLYIYIYLFFVRKSPSSCDCAEI